MSQSLTLKIRGLYSHDNELSAVPEGALSVADDIVINRESVAEPRRGFDRLPAGFSDASYRANKLFFYQNKLIAHYSTNLLAYYATSWNAYSGTYDRPPNGDSTSIYSTIPIRAAESNQNFYFTTAKGVHKLDKYNSTPRLAGAPKALDIQSSIPNTPTAAWLADKHRVAYRVVWGYKDANDNLILGAPSQRESLTNTSGITADVELVITIPDGIDENWFYQIYRSSAVDNSSGDIEPNDELGLVYEGNPNSTDLANGYVTVVDITPDELRGATIYTAASQQGLVSGNEPPPMAKDIAVFKGHMFYANTTSKHRFYLTLLGTGGVNGLDTSDTVEIGGVTYTAASAEDIGNAEFKVYTGGSAAQDIRDTALSLVRVINRHADSTVVAYYLSGPDDLPGKILIEEKNIGGSAFTVESSNVTAWSPNISTEQTSTNDRYKNALFFSKESQPEAVPLVNFFFVGSEDKEILRIVPLRDSLFILKADGIFKLSGAGAGSFRVDLFDSTTRLLAPETVSVLSNQIYALTDQGVVSISEGGVVARSRPIESTLLSLQGVDLDALRNLSFAVSYESERKYILFVPTLAGDLSPTQAFVYNIFTNAWTRWVLNKTCGAVSPHEDKLYLGDAGSEYINIERKTFSYRDQVDFGFTTALSSVDGRVLTLSSAGNISPGDIIYQSDSVYGTVESIDTIASTVTVDHVAAFQAGTVDVLKAIPSKIAWVPFTLGNPGITKQFREATLLFKRDFTGTGYLVFTSDISASEETEELAGRSIGSWGLFPWGQVPWGWINTKRPIRVFVPRNKQRCSQLSVEFRHTTGYALYQLVGISIIANAVSERVSK